MISAVITYANVKDWVLTWAPILFFGLIAYFMWRTIRLMPRTKPVQIKPETKQSAGWEDIAGADEAKHELQEVVEFLRYPKRFAALGAKVPKGILLHGPPGTGKTLLAKAVAHESGANFFSQSAASFIEMFAGLGAARIRRLFSIARKHAPAVIFIDELDAVGGARSGGGGDGGTSEREQALNQLLVELDGFEKDPGTVIVIAASNYVDKLDRALLRPGRFDRQVLVAPPDRDGREAILRSHALGKPLADDLDLADVARKTTGMTGAQLANALNEGAIIAGRAGREAMAREDLDEALLRQSVGSQQARRLNAKERRIVAYHEAGHALCRRLLGLDPPEILSIVPRGPALGFVGHSPSEDSYLKSRDELVDEVVTLLGGRAAEEEVMGEAYSGAVDDLSRVHAVCKEMATEFGMGVAVDGGGPPPIALPTSDYAISDTTRRDVDVAAMTLAREAFRRARALLGANRECLDDLAASALERETLTREELDAIFARHELRGLAAPYGSGAALVAMARETRE